MKKIAIGIIAVSLPIIAFAFVPKHSASYYETQKPEVQEAWRKGAKAKIVYRIVDDEGNPLANQRVHYVWQNDYPRRTWGEYANTDTNGEFVAQAKVGSELTVLDDGHYMVFRTRTTVDDDGKLVSAHYGKIYGRWGIWGGTRARMMFFNTTPNGTNLEDMATYKESELMKVR